MIKKALLLGLILAGADRVICSCQFPSLSYSHFLYKEQVVPWLWSHSLDQFSLAFSQIVTCYKNNYDSLIFHSRMIASVDLCHELHIFLSRTRIYHQDITSHNNQPPAHSLDIFTYWRTNKYQDYPEFYALYADLLSRVLVPLLQDVYNAVYHYERSRDPIQYKNYARLYKHTENYYQQLLAVRVHLAYTPYEQEYMYQLQRYSQLFLLVSIKIY